jgi:Xaa-Pro aminopeptidase
MRDPERVDRIRNALCESQWDLVVCALPMNVLPLSGYWPVVGTGVAVASSEGRITLLVPEDEEDLAKRGWANEIRTFKPGSLGELITTAEAVRTPLRDFAESFCAEPVRVGFGGHEISEPASYAAIHLYGGTMRHLPEDTFNIAALAPADAVLADLRTHKTEFEIGRLRTACQIAGRAFQHGFEQVKAGATEVEVAATSREPLSASLANFAELGRADGFSWRRSGANFALASGAHARSRAKRLESGGLVLVHCNSYADGYWTDVTRTYSLGKLDERRERRYDAVFAAREAALTAVRPGAKAADVDKAARDVLEARGFGSAVQAFHRPWRRLFGDQGARQAVRSSEIRGHARNRHGVQRRTRHSYRRLWAHPPLRQGDSHRDGAKPLTPFQRQVAELVIDG